MFKKILVRAPNWIGDAVMATPALSALRVRFPEAEITLLAKPPVAALFEGHPAVDRLFLFKDPGEHAGLSGRWRLARSLRKERFDLAFLLQNAFEAAAIAWGAGIPERVGYAADGRGPLLTRSLPKKGAPRHQREAYSSLMTLLGEAHERAAPYLIVTAGERRAARAALKSYGISGEEPLVGINSGAAYGSSKRWPPGRFAEVADRLAERLRARIVLFGGEREIDLTDEVRRTMKSPAVTLAGKTTVREMMALISQLDLFVTNDSGPMHVASALGVPVVAVFGPTDPRATAPGGGAFTIVQEPVDCAPCRYRECPIDHRCMERVSVDAVVEAAEKRLLQSYMGACAAGAKKDPPMPPRPSLGQAELDPRSRFGKIAVFLDRDGTINVDVGHMNAMEKFSLVPGSAAAIAQLNRAGVRAIIVTNQSGVVRGMFTEAFVGEVHRLLQGLLAREGGRFDGAYFCPHHPDFVPCDCRKPAMGMVERAIEEYGIDLSRSYVVGDKPIDMALAQRGAKGILVQTGYGKKSLQEMTEAGKRPDQVAPDLAGAVQWILEDIQKRSAGPHPVAEGAHQPGDRSPRIALVKLGSIGDCVHMLPVVPALRKHFPKAYIAWIVEEKSKEIPLAQEGIDEVIVVDTKLWRRLVKRGKIALAARVLRSFWRRLRDQKFDFTIDAQGLAKSGLVAQMTGAPVRIGFTWKGCREGWNTLFTNRRVSPMGAHVIEQNLSLLEGLGISDRSVSLHLTLPTEAVERVSRWRLAAEIAPDAAVVALHPGAAYETKRWPLSSFITLAERLMAEKIQVVITSAGEFTGEIERLEEGKKESFIAPPLTLKELAALYRSCRVMVAGDTGPLHIAAAVGCPTVGLFGPSEARRSGPLGKAHRIIQMRCACRGASSYFPRHCRQKIGCIEEIQVEEVYQKVKEILKTDQDQGGEIPAFHGRHLS